MIAQSRPNPAISQPKPAPKKQSPQYIQPVPISWLDFQGEIDKDSRYHAHCYWKISYTYTTITYNTHVKAKIAVKCMFDKKRSWTKS
mmetsp:Transcript_36435/g.32709  ORF Transcript_36435/g.32709 Transcript_36435/m.32709 type:complete len:87 (+) Transcript_36435:1-261(+)